MGSQSGERSKVLAYPKNINRTRKSNEYKNLFELIFIPIDEIPRKFLFIETETETNLYLIKLTKFIGLYETYLCWEH
jgi:hypothetical protein